MSWGIHIEHGGLSFSAAHFISLEGEIEPLHGHNYGVSVHIESNALTSQSYVLDFGVVKRELRAVIAQFDHRFLLPLHNPFMQVSEEKGSWRMVLPNGEQFLFPASSVTALNIDNATAERLAELLALQLRERLQRYGNTALLTMKVGIAETETQTAFYTVSLSE